MNKLSICRGRVHGVLLLMYCTSGDNGGDTSRQTDWPVNKCRWILTEGTEGYNCCSVPLWKDGWNERLGVSCVTKSGSYYRKVAEWSGPLLPYSSSDTVSACESSVGAQAFRSLHSPLAYHNNHDRRVHQLWTLTSCVLILIDLGHVQPSCYQSLRGGGQGCIRKLRG